MYLVFEDFAVVDVAVGGDEAAAAVAFVVHDVAFVDVAFGGDGGASAFAFHTIIFTPLSDVHRPIRVKVRLTVLHLFERLFELVILVLEVWQGRTHIKSRLVHALSHEVHREGWMFAELFFDEVVVVLHFPNL